MAPSRPHWALPLFLGVLVTCWGCSDTSSSLALSVEGPEKLPTLLSDGILVESDGDSEWTRDVDCRVSLGSEGSSYRLGVSDRSIGDGLELDLMILLYEGPGDYERDEFQPQPALSLVLEEEGNTWRFGSDSGGACRFSLGEQSRSGSFDCWDIPIIENFEISSSTIQVNGSWTCGLLRREVW